jgi:hypothetical protein
MLIAHALRALLLIMAIATAVAGVVAVGATAMASVHDHAKIGEKDLIAAEVGGEAAATSPVPGTRSSCPS